MVIRCIVAGSRGFVDCDVMEQVLTRCFRPAEERGDEVIIVSGTARGADRMGEQFAHDFHHQVERFPANWDLYGKSAGYRRNEEMARHSTHLIVFWDGESRGTKHMVDIAVAANLEVRVFDFDGKCRYVHHGSLADTPVIGGNEIRDGNW